MLTLNSPAKVNLFLRILRKRSDGYHELASLMQTISLMDTIHYSLANQDELICTDPAIPVDSTNLIAKAIDLFRRKTGKNIYVKAHLEKRIPHQAGLGGGSSNAATTLWALNQLCGNVATEQELALWGSEIGSDISFFLSTGTAYCTGRGEILRSLPALDNTQLWIIKPHEGLSTADVYRHVETSRLGNHDPEQLLTDIQQGKSSYINDLEEPAFRLMPALGRIKHMLQQQGGHATMSGSGSAFFCTHLKKMPELPHLFCQQASFINRQPGSWW